MPTVEADKTLLGLLKQSHKQPDCSLFEYNFVGSCLLVATGDANILQRVYQNNVNARLLLVAPAKLRDIVVMLTRAGTQGVNFFDWEDVIDGFGEHPDMLSMLAELKTTLPATQRKLKTYFSALRCERMISTRAEFETFWAAGEDLPLWRRVFGHLELAGALTREFHSNYGELVWSCLFYYCFLSLQGGDAPT